MEEHVRSSNAFISRFLGVAVILTACVVLGFWAIRRIDTLSPPPNITTKVQPTVVAPPPAAPPAIPAPPPPAILPTAHIPVVVNEEYQAAPPADVPVESLQPRSEVVTVKRAPEEIRITRTIPQNPSGPPIVIDKGQKRRGVPKP